MIKKVHHSNIIMMWIAILYILYLKPHPLPTHVITHTSVTKVELVGIILDLRAPVPGVLNSLDAVGVLNSPGVLKLGVCKPPGVLKSSTPGVLKSTGTRVAVARSLGTCGVLNRSQGVGALKLWGVANSAGVLQFSLPL